MSSRPFLGSCSAFPDQALMERSFGSLLGRKISKESASFLYLPKGRKESTMIEVTLSNLSHLLILAEEESEAEIVLSLEGEKIHHTTEVILGDGARIHIVCLVSAVPNADVEIKQKSRIGGNASVSWHQVSLGGKGITHNLLSEIRGAGSVSSIDWIFCARGKERYALSAQNTFDAQDGGGEITVHGVVEDHAHATFEGKIEITPNARGTNTYLTEKTLMLDPTAKVDAVPALEIKTNDVKASHSATVTRVSPEDLFYASSRGIPEGVARHMIIEGFLMALVERFPDGIRERVEAIISAPRSLPRAKSRGGRDAHKIMHREVS